MKNIKRRKQILKTFLILIISGLLFLHFFIPRLITEIQNPVVQILKGNYFKAKTPNLEYVKLRGKFLSFKSFDNVELSSYLTYSKLDNTKGTIILLHGIRSNKECFIELSDQLSKLGYNSVALDSRAHGNSKGTHCTFGSKEKKDISMLIDVLAKQENITKNIGIWGKSLGGAIGLQALGNDKRIKFGVIESTFSDFRTITNDYFNYHIGFNIKPITNYLITRAGQIAEFDPEEAKPIQYCKTIKQPILIVHGNKDQRINIKYGKDNFSKIPSSKKEFIEIENANHLNVWDIGSENYFNRVFNFLENNTKSNTL